MIILIILLVIITYFLYKYQENWIPYKELPYGDWKTARQPLAFYSLPRYREPYNYPVRFKTNHPVKHCATL